MKRQEMISQIKKRFGRICPLGENIVRNFGVEDIHQFRVEIKKLRAFLRLLRGFTKDGSRPVLRKKMKKAYGEMGRMRNLQLVQAKLVNNAVIPPDLFEADLLAGRKKIAALLKDGRICKKSEQRLEAQIPEKWNSSAVEKYVAEKAGELQDLLRLPSPGDESLHLLRKLLKDIGYNWPFIEPVVASRFPAGLSSLEAIKRLAVLLGEFQDEVAGLALLQKAIAGSRAGGPGLAALQSGISARESEKKAIGESIYRRLEAIRDPVNAPNFAADAPAHKKVQ